MVWDARFPDLPVPTPGQMSPVNQAFAQAIDNYTKQANASAKMTYSNLMGPQFMAKALANENILANDPRAQQHIQQITNAAEGTTGQGGGGLLSQLAHIVSQVIHGGHASNPVQMQQQQQPYQSRSNQSQDAQPQDNAPQGSQESNEGPATGFGNTSDDQMINAWVESPEAKQQAKEKGFYDIPSMPELKKWWDTRQNNGAMQAPAPVQQQPEQPVQPQQQAPQEQPQQMPTQNQPKSVAENSAEFQKIKEQGKESGKVIANQIDKLDDQYESALTAKTNLDKLGGILSSPSLKEMRQLSVGGKYELGYFAANGTPEQKEIVGKLKSGIGNIVVDMAGNFKGAFRVGEQKLIDDLKVNDNDPIDVAIGKWQSAQMLNEVKLQRTRLAAQLMISRHINKGEALEKAKNVIKSEDVERQVDDMIHPKVTIKNKNTGEIKTLSVKEARRLGVSNV